MSIPVEKRDLGEGWTLTCRGAGGGDLTLTELNLKVCVFFQSFIGVAESVGLTLQIMLLILILKPNIAIHNITREKILRVKSWEGTLSCSPRLAI